MKSLSHTLSDFAGYEPFAAKCFRESVSQHCDTFLTCNLSPIFCHEITNIAKKVSFAEIKVSRHNLTTNFRGKVFLGCARLAATKPTHTIEWTLSLVST